MGRDIHVRLVTWNETYQKWSEIKFYKKVKNDFIPIDFYPYRNYELFEELEYIPWTPIDTKNLPPATKEELETMKKEFGYYNFREVNFADLKIYFFNHQKEKGEDEDGIITFRDNPLKNFIERIESILDIYDFDLYGKYSSVRIIFFFDC